MQIEKLELVLKIVNELEIHFKSEPRLFFNLSSEDREKFEALSLQKKIFWIIDSGNRKYQTLKPFIDGTSILQCEARRHRSTGDLYRISIGMGIDISLEDFIYQLCQLRENKELFTIYCPDVQKRVWDTNIR